MAGLLFDKPIFGSTDVGVAGGLALKQESGAVRELSDGCIDAEVPDSGGDEILARFEVGGEVEPFVAPVGEVAAGRAVADALAVDPEDESVVGTDADDVCGGNRRQVDGALEMQHKRVAQRGGWVRDPHRVPGALWRVGLFRGRWCRRCGRLGEAGRRSENEC